MIGQFFAPSAPEHVCRKVGRLRQDDARAGKSKCTRVMARAQ
jgi:hypothetical protein